jgi:hypothetical protein
LEGCMCEQSEERDGCLGKKERERERERVREN